MSGPVPGGPPVVRGNGPGAWPQANPGFGGANPRRTIVIAVVVVVLLVVAGVIIANVSGGDDDGSTDDGRSQSGGQTGQQDDEAEGEDGQDPDSGSDPHPDGGGDDQAQDREQPGVMLPDGYEKAVDKQFHFTMAMPEDFQRTGVAGTDSGAKYGSPDGGYPKLQVDYNDSPVANAVLAWKALAPAVRKSSQDYKPLFLKSVNWRGYPTVADWGFTRTEGDQQVRVLNRGFKVDGKRGYAIMVTCKAGEWDGAQCVELRETVLRTFNPL